MASKSATWNSFIRSASTDAIAALVIADPWMAGSLARGPEAFAATIDRLFVERSAPRARAGANDAGEDLCQVTLIREPARQRDIPQR